MSRENSFHPAPEPLSGKGLGAQPDPVAADAVARAGWSVLDGDVSLPVAVLRDAALHHNLAWMRDFIAA